MKKVWIDCDPGIDDMLALLYALKSDKLDVLGISTVSGNVIGEAGAENVLKLLTLLNRDDVQVHVGYKCDNYVNARDTHGSNGIGGYYMPINDNLAYGEAPLDSMRDAILNNPNEVTLVCLGPLTNLYKLLAKPIGRQVIDCVREIIVMGGCYIYPGNCSPITEYNFWCDPDSASKVFTLMEYCNKLKVVTLETTHKFILTSQTVLAIKSKNEVIGNFVEGITEYYFNFHKMQEGLNDGCVINDVVVIGALILEDIVEWESEYVKVYGDASSKDVRGVMLVDRKHFYKKLPNCKIATKFSDVASLWGNFISTITK